MEKDKLNKETVQQLVMNENDIIAGIIAAASVSEEDYRKIEIVRNKKLLFEFRIRPLKEEEYMECKKKHTKYVRNKQLGMKLPEDTNSVKYRAALIYTATVEEDRAKTWDNKKVWEALSAKGIDIIEPLALIEQVLLSGEKDRVVEAIDEISGYESAIEEVVKN